jgi:hypothetical protein
MVDTPIEDLPLPPRQAWRLMVARQGQITSPLVQHGGLDGAREKARPA